MNYDKIQDERIKNIDKSIEKLAHHMETLNHEMGDTQKDMAFMRANLQALADANRKQDERMSEINEKIDNRMCVIEKRQWYIATGILVTILILIANLLA